MNRFPSLEAKLERFEELELQLQDPAVYDDSTRMIALQREHGGLNKVATAVRAHHAVVADIEAAEMMVDRRIHHLLVSDEIEVIGILSTFDLITALAA